MDETLNDIFLMSAHNHATHVCVVGLGKKIPGVSGVAAVFQGYEMVFLVASHAVGMRHAPGGIGLPGVWIDEFRPGLVDRVPIVSNLPPLQLARVRRWWPDQLRAPLAGANGAVD